MDSLFVVPAWVEAHCVVPDFEFQGAPFRLSDEQLGFLVRFYELRAGVDEFVEAEFPGEVWRSRGEVFRFQRGQLVRAQKWGKSPLVAAQVCAEAVGPVLFAGRAVEGDVFSCREHGCLCGWLYEYRPGEAMGRPWPTATVAITATSEDQTANTYAALRPMIELGPLADVIPRTTEEVIRLPNGGTITPVTSAASSRLGARITFAVQDETGIWTRSNGGHFLATTQQRSLAGMRGRAVETTNAWNPAEDSVAQRSFESLSPDILKDFRRPPDGLDFASKDDRRKIFEFNYGSSPWVVIDSIERAAVALMEKNPREAERFFGNRVVAGSGAWMDMSAFRARVEARVVPEGSKVTVGFDGSDYEDWTVIRAETLDGFQWTPRFVATGQPMIWDPARHGGVIPREQVLAGIHELFDRFDVQRMYADPWRWETDIDRLGGEFPGKVFRWPTNKEVRMHAALERLRTDVVTEDSGWSHDDCQVTEAHFRNAVEVPKRGQRYVLGKASGQKIDAAMSSVLAHEAAGDALAAGALRDQESRRKNYVFF